MDILSLTWVALIIVFIFSFSSTVWYTIGKKWTIGIL